MTANRVLLIVGLACVVAGVIMITAWSQFVGMVFVGFGLVIAFLGVRGGRRL
jgi:hypothetical protein